MIRLNPDDRLDMAINTVGCLQMVDWVTLSIPHDEPHNRVSCNQLLLQPLEILCWNVLWHWSALPIPRLSLDLKVLQSLFNIASEDFVVIATGIESMITHLLL